MNFNKKIWLLIILGSLLRVCVAVFLELGNDEVYYQTYAQHLQWNYFDHPPMVALLIRVTTFNLYFQNEFFIRLGPILCAALGTWLIYITGQRIGRPNTGWIAAILYNTSFYTSIVAGTFILPDSPQAIFWLFSIYLMVCILQNTNSNRRQSLHFILLGISIGLCTMSKVHGIFLWFGFGAYIIFHRRNLLKKPMLWVSGFISCIIIYPIYNWNVLNHFITYSYHGNRIRFFGSRPDLDSLLQQVLGSVFYSNPVNYVIYILALLAIAKNKVKGLPDFYPLFLWLGLPLILVLFWTSLFSETLPHWSGPAYLSIMLLAAYWLGEKTAQYNLRWLKPACWVYAVIVVAGVLVIRFLPFRIGSTAKTNLGKGDITLDMNGWRFFSDRFDSICQKDLNSLRMKENVIIISDYWFPAGHLDHYYAIPHHKTLLALGGINDIHHFAWLNLRRPRLTKGMDAYFVYPSNYYGPPKPSLKKDFSLVEDSFLIPQYRMGNVVRYFVVYRLHSFLGDSLEWQVPGIR